MADRDAFLRAIRARPADDLPRLAFADWLDERGDPLGEFIRVQLDLDPIRGQLTHPRHPALMERESQLLRRHRRRWARGAPAVDGAAGEYGPVFARGLPDRVCLSLDTLSAAGGKLFGACPTVREVAVFRVQGQGRALAECPPLAAGPDVLEIADWPTARDVRALLRAPWLGRVPVLRLWHSQVETSLLIREGLAGRWAPAGRAEVVQLLGGQAAGRAADRHDREADDLVRELNRVWGREAAVVVRPFRVPLAADFDGERGFWTGRLGDGRPVFVDEGRPPVFVVFDADGRFVEALRPASKGVRAEHFDRWLADAHVFRPGPVRMREFRVPRRLGVQLWAQSFDDYFRHPWERLPWERRAGSDWRNRGGDVWSWLEDGSYVILYGTGRWESGGGDYWAERFTGQITAS